MVVVVVEVVGDDSCAPVHPDSNAPGSTRMAFDQAVTPNCTRPTFGVSPTAGIGGHLGRAAGLGCDPLGGTDPVDTAVEGRHGVDTRGLCARHEVGLCKVEPVVLVELDGTY